MGTNKGLCIVAKATLQESHIHSARIFAIEAHSLKPNMTVEKTAASVWEFLPFDYLSYAKELQLVDTRLMVLWLKVPNLKEIQTTLLKSSEDAIQALNGTVIGKQTIPNFVVDVFDRLDVPSKSCFQSRKVTLGSLGKVSGVDILGVTMFVLLYKGGLVASYGGDELGAYGCGFEGYVTYDGPGIGGVYESGSGVGSAIDQS
ncbi:hypothetical protein VNO80_03727 [Phaseolus coccineus]|uniref:Uncharacterized protein n=1 Tax=Phaseolus coccineus TaxID=3886 RepID=A0AAN9RRR7_PHACN